MAADLERTLIAARYSSRELSKLLHDLYLPSDDPVVVVEDEPEAKTMRGRPRPSSGDPGRPDAHDPRVRSRSSTAPHGRAARRGGAPAADALARARAKVVVIALAVGRGGRGHRPRVKRLVPGGDVAGEAAAAAGVPITDNQPQARAAARAGGARQAAKKRPPAKPPSRARAATNPAGDAAGDAGGRIGHAAGARATQPLRFPRDAVARASIFASAASSSASSARDLVDHLERRADR